MMPRISIPALILAITAFPVSADDMMTGLAAYDAGDYRVAVAHWRAASEAGEIAAMTSLADLYMQGLGVPRDIDKGVYWYRVAAERGDAIAQLNLGKLLGEGTVVPRNRIQAFQWLGLAARQGNAWARNRLRPLAARMSADAIKEAKARIAAWRPKTN